MSEPTGKCELCGEPMPPGEEMFRYHGYSCDCPKPPLARIEMFCQIKFRTTIDGELWIDAEVEGMPYAHKDAGPYASIGPFSSEIERKRAADDLLEMLKQVRPH